MFNVAISAITNFTNKLENALQYVVDTPAKWQEYRDSVKNPWGQFYITELYLRGEIGIVAVPAGLIGEYVAPHIKSARVEIASGLTESVDNYAYNYINVVVKSGAELKKLLLGHGHIYRIVGRNIDAFYLLAPGLAEGAGLELFQVAGQGDTDLPPEYFLDLKRSKKHFKEAGVRVIDYTPVGGWSSPGQLKAGTHVFAARNLPGFHPWAVFNRLTHGMARLERRWPEPESAKESAKRAVRLSQGAAPMTKLSPLGGMAIILGKLGNGAAESDGLAYVKADYVAEAYSTDKVIVSPKAVEGDGCQCRPCITTKTFGLIVNKEFMEELLWGESKYRLEFIFLDEAKAYQKDFEEAVLSGGVSGRYALTDKDRVNGLEAVVLVIVPSRCKENGDFIRPVDLVRSVDYVTDLNGLKAPFSLRMGLSGLNPLTFSHARRTEEAAKTSTQLISKMSLKDPKGTMKFIKELSERSFRKKINGVLEMENRQLSPRELQGGPLNILSAISAKFVKECYQPSFRSLLNKKVEGWSNGLRRLNLPINGTYQKIVPDLGGQFGADLLVIRKDYVEIFAPGLEREGIEEVAAIRYPSQGNEEYTICRVVTRKEMVRRAALYREAGMITEWQFRNLRRMIWRLQGGITAIPQSEYLLDLFGGADFDGDGIILISEEGVVEILKKDYKTTAVKI